MRTERLENPTHRLKILRWDEKKKWKGKYFKLNTIITKQTNKKWFTVKQQKFQRKAF